MPLPYDLRRAHAQRRREQDLRNAEIEEKARAGAPANKAIFGAPENKEGGPNPLAGIDFASDAAAELAMKGALRVENFKGASPSGANGFTVADVRALIGPA